MENKHEGDNGFQIPEVIFYPDDEIAFDSDIDDVDGPPQNGHGSFDSLRGQRNGRLSFSSDKVVFRDSLSPEKDPSASRLKKKIRHLSGVDKEKLENLPSLSVPITVESLKDFSEYLRQHSFKTTEIVKILSESDLNPDDIIDEDEGKSALHYASEVDDFRLCEALLQNGHSPACQSNKGYTPLHLAIFKHHTEIVKKLLSPMSEAAKIKDGNGNAPIHIAVMSQNHEAIKYLKSKSVEFGVLNKMNLSPLHMAANIYRKVIDEGNGIDIVFKIENMVKLIIENLNPEDLKRNLLVSGTQENPLHTFAKLTFYEGIQQICDKVNDPEVFESLNHGGLTPFMLCIGQTRTDSKKKQVDMAEVEMHVEERRLEREKKKIHNKEKTRRENLKNKRISKKDTNPYQLNMNCAKLLLKNMTENVVNDSSPDLDNMTALQIILHNVKLHDKSSEIDREIVDLLLRRGANVNLTSSTTEEAPINIVLSQNFNKDMLILFIGHLKPENINYQDDDGETVLHYAVSLNDEESIVGILEKGANVMIKTRNVDLVETNFYTSPNTKAPGRLRPRIPLVIALNHSLNAVSNTYFSAMRRVGISRVMSNIKNTELLDFFELHIIAAAFISDNQAVRELCKLLTSKSSIQKLSMTNRLTEEEVVKQVIHFTQEDHFEKTFHKTALAWTNENDDPISASDLLHLEYQSHSSKAEGLSCMKKQLTNDKLLYWMSRTYSKFYPTPNYILWVSAIVISIFQLGFSYFFYVFDILSDYQLTTDYANAYSDVGNYTLSMLECAQVNHTYEGHHNNASCFKFADKYPETTYRVAFILTWVSMVVSVAVYFIGIIFFFDSKNITEKLTWLHKETDNSEKDMKQYLKKMLQYVLIFFIKLFWPFFHIYRRVRYEASRNKSKRRKNYIEFESIWIMVKTIEYGIEATIQLIVVLYLLVPYYDEIHDWDFQITVKKTFFGIAHFVSGGRYKQACLLEKVLGKLAINLFAQSLSLTFLKYMKYGMSIFEHISNMLPLYLSYLSQIVARILVLRVFFVTAEDLFQIENKGLAIGLFFIIHFSITLAIKLLFEIRIEDMNEMDFKCLQSFVKFVINWISSSLVYIWSTGYGANPRTNIHEHNTFLPQLFFQLLVLVEHLILVLFPLSLSSTNCLDIHTFTMTAKLVP